MKRIEAWSSGGGTQSCAIAVLIAQGILKKPDVAVMVDTEREASEVFEYHEKYIKPLLSGAGVELQIIRKSAYEKCDIFSRDGESTLPGYFTTYSGSAERGKQPGRCSNYWKRRVFERHVNKCFPGSRFNVWMGMSTDELRRVKVVEGKWQKKYPLIDLRLSRDDCISIVEKAGLPTPPRSACWMCPNRHDSEWAHLKENSPNDFNEAVKHERELRKTHPWLWLHTSCQPLDQVQFDSQNMELFQSNCESGFCYV